MYTIPEIFDTTLLENRIVEQVCFSINTISLHLGLDTYIRIEGEYIVESNNLQKMYSVYPLTNDNYILKLLECKIDRVIVHEDRRNLTLTFSNKTNITLIGNELYESYFLKTKEMEILI